MHAHKLLSSAFRCTNKNVHRVTCQLCSSCIWWWLSGARLQVASLLLFVGCENWFWEFLIASMNLCFRFLDPTLRCGTACLCCVVQHEVVGSTDLRPPKSYENKTTLSFGFGRVITSTEKDEMWTVVRWVCVRENPLKPSKASSHIHPTYFFYF